MLMFILIDIELIYFINFGICCVIVYVIYFFFGFCFISLLFGIVNFGGYIMGFLGLYKI